MASHFQREDHATKTSYHTPVVRPDRTCSGRTHPASPSVSNAADWLSNANIEGLKALPIHGLSMVKVGGKTFFMSDNGRFVITGTLLDVWNRVAVTELDQVEQIANRIDLSKMKLKIDDLGPITFGSGKAQVAFFNYHYSRFAHFNCQFPGLHFDPLVNCRWKADQSQNALLNGTQWGHAVPF